MVGVVGRFLGKSCRDDDNWVAVKELTWGSDYLQFSALYPLIGGSNPLNCRYLGPQVV